MTDAAVPRGRPRMLAAWIVAGGIEWGGVTVMSLVLGVRMHTLTNSAFWLGVQVASLSLPYTLLSVHAGWILDRVATKKLLLACYLAEAAVAALLAVSVWTDRFNIPVILVASAALGTLITIEAPANWYVIRQLSSGDRLVRASSWSTTVSNLGVLCFLTVMGLELRTFGAAGVFVAYVVVAVPLLAVIVALPKRAPAAATADASAAEGAVDGAAGAVPSSDDSTRTAPSTSDGGLGAKILRNRGNSGLMAALALIPLIAAFMTPLLQMLPALASWATGSSSQVGGFAGAAYLGCMTVVAAVWIAERRHATNRWVVLGSFVATGLALALIGALGTDGATDPRWWALLIGLFVVGLTSSLVNVVLMAVVQNRAPVAERGFFLGVGGFLLEGLLPVTAIVWGLVIDVVGFGWAMVIASVVLWVLIAYHLSRRHFRRLDAPSVGVESAGGASS